MDKKEEEINSIINLQECNQTNINDLSNLWEDKNFFEDQNIDDNKNILDKIYGKEIFAIIDELTKIKENSNVFMNKKDEDLNIKYDHFKNVVLRYIHFILIYLI